MRRVGSAATFVLALAWLHALTTLPVGFDVAAWPAALAQPSPDVLLLLACTIVAGLATGWWRCASALAGVLLVVATLVRHVTTKMGDVLQRQCEFDDAGTLPYLWEQVFRSSGRPLLERGEIEAIVALSAAALLLCYLTARAFGRVTATARGKCGAAAWLLLLQGTVAAALFVPRVVLQPSGLGMLANHALQACLYWLDPTAVEAPIRERIEAGAERLRAGPFDVAALEGADVHVLVVESYGAVAQRHPEIGAHVRAVWRELDAELRAAGCAMVTGVVHPSIVSGQSWLSHQELLCSATVPDQRTWKRLVAQPERPALPKVFAQAGYRTVEVLPAMPRHWNEGAALYGFGETVTQQELRYPAPVTASRPMPDQFPLHYLLERIVRTAERPVFSMFVSVSSHAPWTYVPRYVADWRIDPPKFDVTPMRTYPVGWLDVPHDPRLVPAYTDTIEYALRSVVGFTCRLPRPSLVIVLGDHQPPIAHAIAPPDPTYDVPLHVLTNRPELLEPLQPLGFANGFELPQTTSLQLAELAPALLRAYSTPPPAAK